MLHLFSCHRDCYLYTTSVWLRSSLPNASIYNSRRLGGNKRAGPRKKNPPIRLSPLCPWVSPSLSRFLHYGGVGAARKKKERNSFILISFLLPDVRSRRISVTSRWSSSDGVLFSGQPCSQQILVKPLLHWLPLFSFATPARSHSHPDQC